MDCRVGVFSDVCRGKGHIKTHLVQVHEVGCLLLRCVLRGNVALRAAGERCAVPALIPGGALLAFLVPWTCSPHCISH